MLTRLRKREKGFTLIELLIVVAIIGIIAALLIPNFLDSLQKAKQKRSVADIRNTGTAWMAWLTDELQASAAGRASTTAYLLPGSSQTSAGVAYLATRYIQKVPDQDGWKNPLNYYQAASPTVSGSIMAIASSGADADLGQVKASNETTPFDPTDYDHDILWGDGFFIYWPQKTTQAAP
jgi:type II secretion system protein G